MTNKQQDGGQGHHMTKRQEQGYDEAAHGGADVPASDVGVPPNGDEEVGGDAFDCAARDAANDVRRQDKSAD